MLIVMLCMLTHVVFLTFGCYVDCHIVCLTYLDVMLIVILCIFDIFGCYVACHVVYLTYLDVASHVVYLFGR